MIHRHWTVTCDHCGALAPAWAPRATDLRKQVREFGWNYHWVVDSPGESGNRDLCADCEADR